MFKRNDGKGDNILQNRFTAFLKASMRNRKIDYIRNKSKTEGRETHLESYQGYHYDDYDFIDALAEYEALKSALSMLSVREREILTAHLIYNEDFSQIGRRYGLTYKGAASVFYRTVKKLRYIIGGYFNEL